MNCIYPPGVAVSQKCDLLNSLTSSVVCDSQGANARLLDACDEALLHRIVAASDILFCPDVYESSGQSVVRTPLLCPLYFSPMFCVVLWEKD